MYELKTISAKSSARVTSFVAVVVYIIFAIISLATGTTAFGTGVVSLVIGVVLFGIIGALLGVVLSWAYNFSAKHWGGFHLDFRLLDEEEPQSEGSKENKDQKT
ncbi:hypothetical protein BK004_04350 [bacterium CG10_46_32]|nr:MAG: hypothetical protein BK004_04350 [bacterium CG10_46_32]PIR55776.1 MAG: hypothetical protein COU73_04390 [Parcubacteria group bacterium CG10_big_fil_rev_8_21_14_0_10_46_32]